MVPAFTWLIYCYAPSNFYALPVDKLPKHTIYVVTCRSVFRGIFSVRRHLIRQQSYVVPQNINATITTDAYWVITLMSDASSLSYPGDLPLYGSRRQLHRARAVYVRCRQRPFLMSDIYLPGRQRPFPTSDGRRFTSETRQQRWKAKRRSSI